MPTRIIFGNNSLEELRREACNYGKKGLIVTGLHFAQKTGLLARVKKLLKDGGVTTAVFAQVESDPSFDTVMKGVSLAKRERVDLIIGLGGGSPIDASKLIAASLANPKVDLENHTQGGKIQSCFWKGTTRSLSLIAIPTTAGTGTEASKAAVIADKEYKIKCSIKSKFFFPDLAILDPALTYTLPEKVTAMTGVDALTHAVEAYVSNSANYISDVFALETIRLVGRNLIKAVKSPKSEEARAGMLLASLYGGIADNNAGLGADHVFAHVLGAQHKIPHGLACAILLPYTMKYNLEVKRERFAKIAKALGCKEKAEESVKAALDLIRKVSLPTNLKKVGIAKSDIKKIIRSGLENKLSLSFNPRPVDSEGAKQLLVSAL